MEPSSTIKKLSILIKDATAGYPVKKLILFGSHAAGTATPDSDYDFLILVDDQMPRGNFHELTFAIHKKLIETSFVIPVDLVVKHVSQYENERDSFESLAYHVSREGVAV
jgi:predicted nucleotidyltransferase